MCVCDPWKRTPRCGRCPPVSTQGVTPMMGRCKNLDYPTGGCSLGTLCDRCGYGPCIDITTIQQAQAIPSKQQEKPMDPQKSPTGYSKTAKAPNPALREIAGRLYSLSFLDMITLATALDTRLKENALPGPEGLAFVMLGVAGDLETV